MRVEFFSWMNIVYEKTIIITSVIELRMPPLDSIQPNSKKCEVIHQNAYLFHCKFLQMNLEYKVLYVSCLHHTHLW